MTAVSQRAPGNALSRALLLATSSLAYCSPSSCPTGWTGVSASGKCMKLLAVRETQEGCAAACGSNGGSLACIQTDADKAVADTVQMMASGGTPDMGAFVWTGEYQFPFESVLKPDSISCQTNPYGPPCLGNLFGIAYNGQTGWGKCSNGQLTNHTPMILAFSQPNNYNGCLLYTSPSPRDS